MRLIGSPRTVRSTVTCDRREYLCHPRCGRRRAVLIRKCSCKILHFSCCPTSSPDYCVLAYIRPCCTGYPLCRPRQPYLQSGTVREKRAVCHRESRLTPPLAEPPWMRRVNPSRRPVLRSHAQKPSKWHLKSAKRKKKPKQQATWDNKVSNQVHPRKTPNRYATRDATYICTK